MLNQKYLSIYRFSKNKIVSTVAQALKGLKSNQSIMVGGFGVCGIPMNLINGICQLDVNNLTIISNDGGMKDDIGHRQWGLQELLKTNRVKRMVSSYLGSNPHEQQLYLKGKLQIQFTPQGTLAQKIRSGGAGIPAFYTRTGVDTMIQTGGIPFKFYQNTNLPEIISKPKQTKIINGIKYLYEESLTAQFALIKAQKADHYGNLIFNKSARNFNEDMCTAAKNVVVEVQQIVENGQLNTNEIHISGIYVDRIFKSDPQNKFTRKKIQKLKLTNKQCQQDSVRMKIIQRAAKQVRDGMNINLGIGIPTLLPQALPSDIRIVVHSQNGVLGAGPYPHNNQEVNPDLINAGKETITLIPQGSYISSSRAFGMIRGGHLDMTMLGAMQVNKNGDIANWIIPGKVVKGMGGAMDLVNSGSKVVVVMKHSAKGSFKLVEQCKLPLTGKGKASMVITQKAVFENRNGRLILIQIAEGCSLQEVQACTGFQIQKADTLKTF